MFFIARSCETLAFPFLSSNMMQNSKTVSESLSTQWRLCCLADVKNKRRLKRHRCFETHFLSHVCVCVGGGEMLLKLPWWFNLSKPHFPPPLSPSFPRQNKKSKHFWEEFPRLWELCRRSPTDRGEFFFWVSVFPCGEPLSDMHPCGSAEQGSYTKQC